MGALRSPLDDFGLIFVPRRVDFVPLGKHFSHSEYPGVGFSASGILGLWVTELQGTWASGLQFMEVGFWNSSQSEAPGLERFSFGKLDSRAQDFRRGL